MEDRSFSEPDSWDVHATRLADAGSAPGVPKSAHTHYQANVCGGDFKHVKERFNEWKQQPLVFQHNRRMFEGKDEVRRVSERVFGNSEAAQSLLREMCDPHASYALAAHVQTSERDQWLVMAAYEE